MLIKKEKKIYRFVYHNIFRLDISMDNCVVVEIFYS